MSNSMKILCAFLAGQVAQIFIFIVARTLVVNRVILWSCAVGFLFLFLLMVGVMIGGGDVRPRKARGSQSK